MFYGQCWKCGERQSIGTASTCKCPDETAKREWVGLTEEEIVLIVAECAASHQHTDIHFARAIEAKLRSKND